MKLNLLDIENFIIRNKLKEVSSNSIYSANNKLEVAGLFSEEIFGRLGSNERRKKFGYIDLRYKFIHPECYKYLCSLDSKISKILNNKGSFVINEKGEILETDSEVGKTGILFIINNAKDINWKLFKNKKPKILDFILKNFDNIFIDKYVVLPAGIRDIQISTTTQKTMIQFSEITELYQQLIQRIKTLPNSIDDLNEEIINPMVQQIQISLLSINTWFKNRLSGKEGIIRGTVGKKTVDYSGRFVVTTDNTLEMGFVGLPYYFIIKLFEPFILHYIIKKDQQCIGLIQNYLKSDNLPNNFELKRFFRKLTEDDMEIDIQLRDSLIEIVKEVTKDKLVLYKRDPVENRDSYLSANLRVDKDGYALALNPLDLPRTGGDHDGDTYAVMALFSKQATKEAKEKMHPKYTNSMWTSVTSIDKNNYVIKMDAAVAIFNATRR